MTHYICTGGCKGVADEPGVCQAQDCPEHDHPLRPCDCTDGKHYGAFEKEERLAQKPEPGTKKKESQTI